MHRIFSLILIILFIAALYGAGSALLKGKSLKEAFSFVSQSASTSFKKSSTDSVSKNYSPPKTEKKPSAYLEPQKPKINPPAGFTAEQLSPYYQKVRLSSVSRGTVSGNKAVTQIALRADSSLKEEINITGWKMKGNKGDWVVVPQAINDLNPLRFWNEGDIIVNSGHYVYLYRASSPMVRSFRLNKCTGYFNEFYKFAPSLPNNCPGIDRDETISFTGKCQNIIASLGRCRVPTSNQLNDYSVLGESACRAYLDEINYRGCYNRYHSDVDFLSKEWRIWLNKSIGFDPLHDRILLFDKNGLLVDEKIY